MSTTGKPVFTNPHDALRYHVTGAIERGEGVAIVEQLTENPRIEWSGESIEHATAYAAFERGDSRYHIWLDPATGKPEFGGPLYKNPRDMNDKTTRTQQLNPEAKCNASLMAELWARTDFAASRAAHVESIKAKKAERRTADEARIELERLQALFTLSEAELRAMMKELNSVQGARGEREIRLVAEIAYYRFGFDR